MLLIRKVLPYWAKGKTNFDDFKTGVADACARARSLEPTGHNVMKNPSTNVWRLVEKISQALADLADGSA